MFAGHLGIGFSVVSLRALAIIARNSIFAYRMLSTGLVQSGTLIDIHTPAEWITGIVRFAGAHEAANGVRADRVLPTRIILALVDVLATVHWITTVSVRTQAAEAAVCVQAVRIPSAGRPCALILVQTAGLRASIAVVSRRAVAAITALEIRTYGTGSADIRVGALVHILATLPIRIVAHIALRAGACVIARRVGAQGVRAAVLRIAALVHIRAKNLAVALVAILALAEEVRRQVAALGVLHAARCYRGILAFVNVFTMEAIATIARKAGTREAAQCVRAMGKHVARPLLAFVLIFVHAVAAAVAVIAMADAVQTRAICALGAILITVICAFKLFAQLIGTKETILGTVA